VSAAINAGPGGSVDLPSADRAGQNSATPIRGRRRAEPAPVAGGSFAAKTVAAVGRAALTILLVLAALVFLFLAVGPRFLNYQTSTMLTGSMSPVINPGDVVVSVRTPVSELEVGDVITYSIPIDDHRIETHRVASIKRDDAGQTSVITKGDANPGADPWTAVLSEDYVYTQAGVVPHLGDAIRALRQPLAQSVLLYGACALLVAVLLTSIWRKSPPDSEASGPNGVGDTPDSEGTPGAEPTPSKL
jgi:signal peptidase